MKVNYIHASSKKEALEIAKKECPDKKYIGVYKRASKGNSFYEFR